MMKRISFFSSAARSTFGRAISDKFGRPIQQKTPSTSKPSTFSSQMQAQQPQPSSAAQVLADSLKQAKTLTEQYRDLKTDYMFQTFDAEATILENKIWKKFYASNSSVTPQSIQRVRDEVNVRVEHLLEKYRGIIDELTADMEAENAARTAKSGKKPSSATQSPVDVAMVNSRFMQLLMKPGGGGKREIARIREAMLEYEASQDAEKAVGTSESSAPSSKPRGSTAMVGAAAAAAAAAASSSAAASPFPSSSSSTSPEWYKDASITGDEWWPGQNNRMEEEDDGNADYENLWNEYDTWRNQIDEEEARQ